MLLQGAVDNSIYSVTPPRTLDFVELGVHPKVAAQPAGSGGTFVRHFFPYQGTLFIGFGDWGQNTGPIALCGYDLVSGEPVTVFESAPTEAILRIRQIDGHLYVPWVDPEWYYGPGGFTTDASGTWENVQCAEMVHTFDVQKFADKFVLCGSTLLATDDQRASGCVWTQVDGEWVRTYHGPDDSRVYRMIQSGGKLWAMAQRDNGTYGPLVSTVDGITWVEDTGGPVRDLRIAFGDVGNNQTAYHVPSGPNVPLLATSVIAGGSVWVARYDGTVQRAGLHAGQ